MNGKVSFVAAMLLAVVGIVAGLLVPVAAHAAPPESRPAPPAGGNASWGMPRSALMACAEAYLEDSGGWNTRTQLTDDRGGNNLIPDQPNNYAAVPSLVQLGEPCVASSTQIGIPTWQTWLSYSKPPSFFGGRMEYTRGDWLPDRDSLEIICQSTEWSKTQTSIKATATSLVVDHFLDGRVSPKYNLSNMRYPASTVNCPYIVRASVEICTWSTWDDTGKKCQTHVWVAEWAFQKTPYQDDSDGGEKYLCQQSAELSGHDTTTWHPDCLYLLPERNVDGTNYEVVCGNPPEAAWLDWSWIAPTIGHYARCLFQPVNGFDRFGEVEHSFWGSPIAAVAGGFEAAVHSFETTGGCGVIVSSPPTSVMGAFTVSTCSWSEWAPPIRFALGVFVSIWFGWWALQFFARSLVGLLDRKTVTPVDGGGDE